MNTVIVIFFLPFLILIKCQSVNDQNWRRIVPLASTRADVERILGPTNEVYFATYRLKEGDLFIEYSSGPCRPERKGGWNVGENVVISVSFSPKHKRRVADLKLDPKKFRKVIDNHAIGILYYINDEEGINYEVQDGKVESIEYYPAKSFEHLHCGDPAEEKQRREPSITPTPFQRQPTVFEFPR